MSQRCSVARCKQRCNQDEMGNFVSFYRFPKEKDTILRTLWIKAIHRDPNAFKINKYSRVCSRHFKISDFLNSHSHRRFLRKGCVPSVFDWDTSFDWHSENVSDNPDDLAIIDEARQYLNCTNLGNLIEDSEELAAITEENVSVTQFEDPTAIPVEDTSVISVEGTSAIPVDIQCSNSASAVQPEYIQAIMEEKISQSAFDELEVLKKENEYLLKQLEEKDSQLNKLKWENGQMKTRLEKLALSIDAIKDKDENVQFYTGLKNYKTFMALFKYLNPGENGENVELHYGNKTNQSRPSSSGFGRPRKLKAVDQLFMVLMRFRLGLFCKDLANRFDIAPSTVSRITITWTCYIYLQLGQLRIWPSREAVNDTMPEDFKLHYPSTRVIIDATEIQCETPKSLVLQSGTFSNYKSRTTYKGLLGITPNGLVSFVSSLYTGSISDKEITQRSGFLDMSFTDGDSVMADKGFLIEDMLKEKNVNLNI